MGRLLAIDVGSSALKAVLFREPSKVHPVFPADAFLPLDHETNPHGWLDYVVTAASTDASVTGA